MKLKWQHPKVSAVRARRNREPPRVCQARRLLGAPGSKRRRPWRIAGVAWQGAANLPRCHRLACPCPVRGGRGHCRARKAGAARKTLPSSTRWLTPSGCVRSAWRVCARGSGLCSQHCGCPGKRWRPLGATPHADFAAPCCRSPRGWRRWWSVGPCRKPGSARGGSRRVE